MTYRDKLSLNIPAFLRGELSHAEVEEIEALAQQDPDFAADIAFQKSLRDTLKNDDVSDSGLEFGWARLSKAIDADTQGPVAAPASSPMAANDRQPKRFWQYAAACLACVAIGQAAFMNLRSDASSDDQYFMAGKSETSISMRVSLNDDVVAKSLTDFLISHDGLVTSGPDSRETYLVTFANIKSCDAVTDLLSQENVFFETYTACGDI